MNLIIHKNHIILSYYFKIYLILNLSIIDRMQPVFNDLNSTHSSLTQLNKLTFLFNPIKSKERVNMRQYDNTATTSINMRQS